MMDATEKKPVDTEEKTDRDTALVSVIITVYNLEKYVGECIEAVSAQTYKNIEIIVVDDGSADESLSVIKALSETDNRIIPVHKENGGVSSARNIGLEKAAGQYLMFVDGDDVLSPDAVNDCLSIFSNDEQVDMVSFSCEKFCGQAPAFDKAETAPVTYLTHKELLHTLARGDFDSGIVCAKMYKAKLWKDLRFTMGMTREDEYVNAELYPLVEKAARTDKKMYYYRMREGSITHGNSKKDREDTLKAFKHRMELLCDGSEDDRLYKFRYIEAVMDLYIVSDAGERKNLRREFLANFSTGNGEILWKRRVLVLLFRICPALYVKVRER